MKWNFFLVQNLLQAGIRLIWVRYNGVTLYMYYNMKKVMMTMAFALIYFFPPDDGGDTESGFAS